MIRLRLLLVSAQFVIVAAACGNELANPGFEQSAAGKLAGWVSQGDGYAIDRQARHDGRQSMRCEAADGEHTYGTSQIIRYAHPDKRPIIVGGWSKAQDVVSSGDYCVYLDVIYADGTPWWGLASAWLPGTHGWQYAAETFRPEKPVREIRVYVFLRHSKGTAWFDDVFVDRGGLHVLQPRVETDFPHTAGGHIRAELSQDAEWRCVLRDAAGRELDTRSGRGSAIVWDWADRENARLVRLSIAAKNASGERVDFQMPVDLPARPRNTVHDGYAVWWRNSMQKIYPIEFPPPERGEAAISLARNEREGFQLAVTPADDVRLRHVTVSVGRLVNERGDAFSPQAIEQHLVGYLYVDPPSSHPQVPDRPNWCPEVLLRGRPFDVPGGRTQTVWINFHAAEALPAGIYRGKVTVQPAGMAASELPLRVRVRGFALPRTPRMKTAFALMGGFLRITYGKITPELRRRSMDLMLSHRLNPDDISRTEPPAVADLLYARQHGLNAFNIVNLVPKPKGNPLWVCYAEPGDYGPDFTQELAGRLDGYVRELRKHDLAKTAYFYGFDERGPEYDELIKKICKFLKQRYPEVSTFTTAGYMYDKRRHVPAGYQDWMDWYCPLTPKYDRELSARLRAQGKQVWWYVCCGPKYPYANFAAADYPSIEGRLLGWMTFGFQADGLLYWHVNNWHPGQIMADGDPYLDYKCETIGGMPGDGCLIYPTADGPVGSIRLENIRDGLEDFDYLALLADKKGRPAAEAYVARLVRSMTEFSRDPAELERVRAEIAEQLETKR
jgi:hypothetical protein